TETREALAAGTPTPDSVCKVEEEEPAELDHRSPGTAIDLETIKRLLDSQVNLPEGFTVHPRLQPILQRRAQSIEDDSVDWATGELLAFGSLLIDGHPVRLVG